MIKFRFLLAATLALLLQALLPNTAYARWLRAESRHFIIYSEGSEKDLRNSVARLERFDALLRLKFRFNEGPSTIKLPIYLVSKESDVKRLTKGWPIPASGFFAPRLEGSFAVAHREKRDSVLELDGGAVLMHEYGHYFMLHHADFAYPAWYVEGFAEFVSTTTIDDSGNWTMGKPAYHRARSLLAIPKLPIEDLLFRVPQTMTREQVSAFYGRSWLLTHMLLTKPEYNERLSAHLAAVAAGRDHRDAATAAFGDLAQLEMALDKYLETRLTYISSNTPVTADITMTVTELDPVSGQLVPLHLDRLSLRDTAGLPAALRQLAEANPGRADLWFELAMAENWNGQKAGGAKREELDTRAEVAVDKVLAIDPSHGRANLLKAEILMRRLAAKGDFDAARWTAARRYLITANSANADDPAVLVAWYDSFRKQRRTPSQTARDGLARALMLAPEASEIRVRYAIDLAEQGRFDEAIRVADVLANDPHGGSKGIELREKLKLMRSRAAPR